MISICLAVLVRTTNTQFLCVCNYISAFVRNYFQRRINPRFLDVFVARRETVNQASSENVKYGRAFHTSFMFKTIFLVQLAVRGNIEKKHRKPRRSSCSCVVRNLL